MDRLLIRKDTYLDSVFLMAASAELGRVPGLEIGQVMLATPSNRELVRKQGFAHPDLDQLGPTDLLITLRAASADALDRGEAKLGQLLESRARDSGPAEAVQPVGFDGGLRALEGANMAVISVPGEYAAYEAWARDSGRAERHALLRQRGGRG